MCDSRVLFPNGATSSLDDVLAAVSDEVALQLRELFFAPHLDVATLHVSQVDDAASAVQAALMTRFASVNAPRAPIRDLFSGMNQTERARAIDLEAMRRAGQIVAWWYEKWTFKLADDLRYTPDFVVQKADGSLEVEEVKGFWREDARAKVKMFVALYPFPTRAYTRAKTHTGWDVETFR